MRRYTCSVCESAYNHYEKMSTVCDKCGKRVCISCSNYDGRTDVCDACLDKSMFNYGNETDFVTKQKIKAK